MWDNSVDYGRLQWQHTYKTRKTLWTLRMKMFLENLKMFGVSKVPLLLITIQWWLWKITPRMGIISWVPLARGFSEGGCLFSFFFQFVPGKKEKNGMSSEPDHEFLQSSKLTDCPRMGGSRPSLGFRFGIYSGGCPHATLCLCVVVLTSVLYSRGWRFTFKRDGWTHYQIK